jgi:hypothetical protein
VKSVVKIFLGLTLFLFFLSCKKDKKVLGVEVQPGEDGLNASYIGDLAVSAHSIPYDSIPSFNDGLKYIGNNIDPHFGRTDIGLYVNTNITTTDLNFGNDARIIDAEIILVLENDWVGDKTASMTYSVFPVDSNLKSSRVYYTSNTYLHNKTKISAHTCTFTTMKIPGSSSSALVPVLRIKIDTAYAASILRDTPNLANNVVYQAKYKGYYVSSSIASASEGVIFKANLDNDYSGLHLFYKNDALPNDTVDFNFKFKGSGSVRFNTAKFDNNSILKNQFSDTTLGGNALYLKGMGNTKLKIQIPFLKDYSDTFEIAVNRAELILNVDPSFVGSGNYTKPPLLTLLSVDSLGRESFLEDLLSVTDYVRYDGSYDKDNNRYVFNLAREAQLIFNGQKKNRGFYLVVANTEISLNTLYLKDSKELLTIRRDNYIERVILAGSANTALKPKFNLSYVKFKNE